MDLTARRKNMISGLIALVLVAALIVVGVSWAFGAFDDSYTLKARFDTAGEGLQKNSDVKIRGINVGKVDSVTLDQGRALVTMSINHDDQIPYTATAEVRSKTLFGEKYVDIDPGANEGKGPYYGRDGEFIDKCDKSAQPNHTCTIGGFEIEQVLSDAYPLLQKIQPQDLMTVLNTLADAGKGLGPTINRSIVNGKKVLDVTAAHDADTRQFLTDLATLSEQLGVRSDDLVAAANSLNVALPPLNARADQLTTLLQQTSRLSNDVADLLDANQGFIDASFHGGQAVLDVVYDHRNDLIPTVVGLREYLQTLTESIHIPVGDGTYMAAVKGITGGNGCGVLFVCPTVNTGASLGPNAAQAPPTTVPILGLPVPTLPPLPSVPGVTTTTPQQQSGVQQLFQYFGTLGQK